MRKILFKYVLIIAIMSILMSGCDKLKQVFSSVSVSASPTIMPEPTPTVSIEVEATPDMSVPTPTPIPFHQLGFVNLQDHTSNLCVRSGPDTSHDVIGAICHGLTVRIFTEVEDWYEIEFDGKIGYCSGDYIIVDNGLSEPLRPQYCVIVSNKTGKEQRDLPNGDYSVGDRVDITGDGIVDGTAIDTNKDKKADAVEIEAKDELIDVSYYCPSISHNIDLATNNNQFKQKIYDDYYVLLQKEVYESLLEAQNKFLEDGLSIKIYDAYRPFKYQQVLYTLSGDEKMFNNTESGSNHNRGAAVDITLVDANGKELEMPCKVHEFGPLASRDNPNISEEAAKNLEYMTNIMMSCGFTTYKNEWWHFNHINAKKFSMREYSDEDFITIRKK